MSGPTGVTQSIIKLTSLHKAKSLCPHLACDADNPKTVVAVAQDRSPEPDGNYEDDEIMNDLVSLQSTFELTNEDGGPSYHRPLLLENVSFFVAVSL